ncbi:MAG TPA: hypothetical protein DIU15_03055 [Deltaproteobacteria bacterium]|nr:hypothetical protein [Deltaproteobacteria bacterium]HCP44989.1 hypothetical protein [Deltaproteobacteria bacterium]
MIGQLREGLGQRIEVLCPLVLLGLAAIGFLGPEPRPIQEGAAWPSLAHPLGVDMLGRDFLSVIAVGVTDFVAPGLLAVFALIGALGLRTWVALQRPVLPDYGAPESAPGGLAGASPPRLLIVLLGMLLLEEPSPLVAGTIVLVLYLPVALNEVASQLRDLREQEVLAGAMAHGLPLRRVLGTYLLLGYLKETIARHAAALFTQVAFTQIALSYLFGASSVRAGFSTSWGMEFNRLGPWLLPRRQGMFCPPEGVCVEAVGMMHAVILLTLIAVLLGGLLRLAQPKRVGSA